MKTQIRRNVFETNSSSMHSLVITKKDEIETSEYFTSETHDVIYYEYELEFARHPFKRLVSFYEKMGFMIAAYLGQLKPGSKVFKKRFDELNEIQKKFDNGFILLPDDQYSDVQTPYTGFIEHDDGRFLKALQTEGISIEDFLTNKKYFVIIDGDEYCIWDGMKDDGLVNMDAIEKEIVIASE